MSYNTLRRDKSLSKSNRDTHMQTFPKNFVDAIKAEECILFIGSGISAWSGLPDWEGLVLKMLEYMTDHGLQSAEGTEINEMILRRDLLTASSLCALLMRKADLRDFSNEIFIKPNPRPHEIHKIIVDLGPDSFITTNYDRLIDDAYQVVHGGLVLLSINDDQPIEQAQIVKHGASRFIFTPHGRADKCDTMVLTREDYRRLKYDSKSTVQTLQHLLISRPVIYLGFGLQDPDFLMFKDEIAVTYQGGEREHFAIIPDASDLQKRFWREQYGINILSYDTYEAETVKTDGQKHKSRKHDNLLHLLKELHTLIKGTRIAEADIATRKIPTQAYIVQVRNSIIRYCEDIVYTYTSFIGKSPTFPAIAEFRPELSKEAIKEAKLGTDRREYSTWFERRNVSLSALLLKFGNLILIGASGAGKTHAVMAHASTIATHTLHILRNDVESKDTDIRQSIPLVLPMREYTGDIVQMIALRLPRSIDAYRALELGWLVLIFDAMNEVSRELVETKVLDNNILWLINRFPHNKFVFTSRSMNYVSSLKLPVFELQPLPFKVIDQYVKDNLGVSLDEIPRDMRGVLANPLFLTLFIQTEKSHLSVISSVASLLRDYFTTKERQVVEETGFSDLSLMKLLTSLAYGMIDRGNQTIAPEQILAHFRRVYPSCSTPEKILSILVWLGVLTPDAEGTVSFFHETALEYLAAIELEQIYQQDSLILEERINLLRWDETIMLLISSLPAEEPKKVLRRIAEKDILFACNAFESATIREHDVGLQLFDIIYERIQRPQISDAAKHDLARAIRIVGPYGRKETLMKLLDDKILAKPASVALARMGMKEAVPKIIELLLEDYVWPSEFAEALELLADESMISELIELGKRAKEEEEGPLVRDNLSKILSNLESERLYSEVSKLAQSDIAVERRFAADILGAVDSERASQCLVEMLSDPDSGVRWRAIFSLHGGFDRRPLVNPTVVAKMFDLLADAISGRWAADYLQEHANNDIIKYAGNQLNSPRNDIERVNLCAVIAASAPKTSKTILFDMLDDYHPALDESLHHALASLGIEFLAPDIFTYLKTDNAQLRLTVLEALRWSLLHEEQITISEDDCEILLTLWEEGDEHMERHIAGFLLSDHRLPLSKNMLLARLSDTGYMHRERLTELVARLPLVKGDLSRDVLEWLVTKLDKKYDWPGTSHESKILGHVCDELFLKERLIPLLNSINEVVRNNAYLAVSIAERTLGKRFIQK